MLSIDVASLFPQVLVGLAVFYAFAVLVATVGLVRLRRSRAIPEADSPRVSVIVACRNEEVDLPRCIAALAALDYPVDRLEVFLVDDQSTDGTADLIADATRRYGHFRGLSTADAVGNLRAKARGVAHGARHATGEWLFITDADGEVQPGWIRHMLSGADERTGIIGGMMAGRGEGLVGTLEQASWAYTLPGAFGLAGWGLTWVCVGPNMAVRRSIYAAAGGLEAASFTIAEDLALFQMVFRSGYRGLAHATPETTVRLAPVPSLRHLISQQRRWLRGGFEGGWSFAAGLIFTFGFLFLLTLGLVAGLFIAPEAALLAWGLKIGADTLMVAVEGWRVGVPLVRVTPVIPTFGTLVFLWLPVSFIFSRSVRWIGQDYGITYHETRPEHVVGDA